MSRRLGLSLAIVTAVACLGCVIWVGTMVHARETGAARAQAGIEGMLRKRDSALAARVTELASLPSIPAALATDRETVRDLTDTELPLRPRDGETITLAQKLRDGRVAVLLSLPQGHAPAVTAPGPGAEIRDGRLLLWHAVAVAPSERGDELTGLVAASETVDERLLQTILPTWSWPFRLTIEGRSIDWGAPFQDQPSTSRSLSLPDGREARLLLPDPNRLRRNLLWAAAFLCVLLSLGFISAGRPKRMALARPIPTAARPRPKEVNVALRQPTAVDIAPPQPTTVEATLLQPTAMEAAPVPPTAVIAQTPGLTPTFTPAAADPSPGQRIGRYALLRRLGEGGMADVFTAKLEGEAGFGKLVALKVLQPSFADHPVALDLFLDEARLVATLDHPNIVQTYDLGRAGDRYFIAMEYVDGIDLGRLLQELGRRNQSVAVPNAIAILCRLCDGLQAAHTAKGPDGTPMRLVHRDVKSANVFLARTGAVKIGDFGIAKANHSLRTSHTEMGQVKGTPNYMPPEQRMGTEVDQRTDIYGIGAIAYEMLSGRTVNLDYVALALQGKAGWPHLSRLTTLRSDVPAQLDDIVFKALSFDRTDRFSSCAAMEEALKAVASSCGMASDKEIGAWVRAELDSPVGFATNPA